VICFAALSKNKKEITDFQKLQISKPGSVYTAAHVYCGQTAG